MQSVNLFWQAYFSSKIIERSNYLPLTQQHYRIVSCICVLVKMQEWRGWREGGNCWGSSNLLKASYVLHRLENYSISVYRLTEPVIFASSSVTNRLMQNKIITILIQYFSMRMRGKKTKQKRNEDGHLSQQSLNANT